MFAVQTIIHGKLYAAETPEGGDVLTACFNDWENPLYVREYLKNQPDTHSFYGVGLKEATKKILKESKNLLFHSS